MIPSDDPGAAGAGPAPLGAGAPDTNGTPGKTASVGLASPGQSERGTGGPGKMPGPGGRVASLPAWFPPWAVQLAELYFSRTTSMFVLGGNTWDYARVGEKTYGTLAEFLAGQLFGRWDLVLHYDLARGLRCLAGPSEERLREMSALANRRVGDLAALPRDPIAALAAVDRLVTRNALARDEDRISYAVIVDHVAELVPRDERGSLAAATHLVTFLNWASSPYVKRQNAAFVLVDPRPADVSERLRDNPHVATLDVPLPAEPERRAFLEVVAGDRPVESFSTFQLPEIAKLTGGIALTDLDTLVKSSIESGRPLDAGRFRELKKRLIERQAQDLLEFVEPKWGVERVIGHEAAKKRLLDDAALIRKGRLDCAPMGYLLSGPVGTGKTFLATCAAGSIGMPCVVLRNFRSKYVGETEGNLEKLLRLLRVMGPVMVLVDEADAVLGDRQQSGDSGVASRVFGMIAAQMGDTRYRGQIVWVLMTARPDLLPIDLKRQGRAEVHIPLFYPEDEGELRQMMLGMAAKLGAKLAPEDVPPIPYLGHLSGADVEGIVGRAQRAALLAGQEKIGRAELERVLADFMPSTQSLERELQEAAAILECTDREFLNRGALARLEKAGGREGLQQAFQAARRALERN